MKVSVEGPFFVEVGEWGFLIYVKKFGFRKCLGADPLTMFLKSNLHRPRLYWESLSVHAWKCHRRHYRHSYVQEKLLFFAFRVNKSVSKCPWSPSMGWKWDAKALTPRDCRWRCAANNDSLLCLLAPMLCQCFVERLKMTDSCFAWIVNRKCPELNVVWKQHMRLTFDFQHLTDVTPQTKFAGPVKPMLKLQS